MGDSVTILMSTFNGERYLREQVDSILSQERVKVTICIRDDGSTDGTLDILNEYLRNNSNVKVIFGKPSGVGRSFMKLLFETTDETDFYAFSDQDDIWDKDKLKCALVGLQKFADCPGLYVCNQRCVDINGVFTAKRFQDSFPKQELVNTLFTNLYAGCTMVFNRALKTLLCEEVRRPDIDFFQHRIHDAWISCVAASLDAIVYDPECHMSFRRHGTNMTDAEVIRGKRIPIRTLIILYIRKVKRRLQKKTNLGNGVELTAKYLLHGYEDFFNSSDRELLIMVRDYRKSLGNRIQLLTSGVAKRAAPERSIDINIKIIMGEL